MQVFEWTHHQKTIIIDAPSSTPARRLVAFVGGLDLTIGRYDTPRHSLFRTLQSDHAHDFYNGWGDDIQQQYGPRQPWHDIHSRVCVPTSRLRVARGLTRSIG
jgi:phospholipase D1/2